MKNNIYEKALKAWGKEAQAIMLFEEMSELQKEICKWFRGKLDEEHLVEEIADVENMLEQLYYIFRDIKDLREKVEVCKKKKLERLGSLLKEDKS